MSTGGIELPMVRRGETLVPTSPIFVDDLLSVSEGKEVLVTVRQPRFVAQHRLFFSVLGEIVKSGQWEGDVESLLDYIKIGVGHVTTVVEEKTGRNFFVLKSINFASMDQTRFERFCRRAEWLLAERLGIDWGAIVEEIKSRARPGEAARERPAEDPPDTFVARLRKFADQLGEKAGPEFDEAWTSIKETREAKALFQRAPKLVEKIHNAAVKLSKGIFDVARYEGVVDAACQIAGRNGEG